MRNYLIRTISVVSTALLLITIGAKVHNSKINEPIAEMTEVTTNNDASDKLNNLETESFIVLEDTPSDFVSYEESHQTETIVNETENDLEQTESPSVKDEQKTSESIVLPEQSTEEQAIESVASTEQSTEEETEAITEQISEEVVDEKTGAIESEKVSPVSPQSEPTELIDLVTESPEDTNSDSLLKEYTDFLSGTSEQVVETQVDQQTETSIQIGKTITLNEEARIYGDEYSAYLEGTSYRPYYKNDEKRVIIGVAVEKDNQLVKIDASQSDANQKINDLINNGGQIVSVLTANQKFLSDYNGSESLLNDEIRAYNEGWYNVNDIAQENTKGLQR